MQPQLSICTFLCSESLAESLSQVLSGDRYSLYITRSQSEFLNWVDQQKQHIDCLVLQDDCSLLPAINRLYEQGTLLPVVILSQESPAINCNVVTNNQHDSGVTSVTPPDSEAYPCLSGEANYLFHQAEVRLDKTHVSQIGRLIDQAITQFLSLAPTSSVSDSLTKDSHQQVELSNRDFLMQQQRRLSEKLKERLGYLGVYYKRNPQLFFRYLPQRERQKLLEQIKSDYRAIILKYFSQDDRLNQEIDSFVHQAFFADISVSKIVEVHMELMEEFSKQLKLEGRSEEILLDYRLTLIDVIAHLGEMYRRSIPREL